MTLDEELLDHIQEGPMGKMIHHPLIIEMFLPELDEIPNQLLEMINKRFEYKKAAIEEAIDASDWHKYVFLHERPYRPPALDEAVFYGLSDREYWELVGEVWTDSENVWQYPNLWHNFWTMDFEGREHVMDVAEQKTLLELPDEITVWRGSHHSVENASNGMSWTIDYEKAKWFANRYKRPERFLAEGKVKKEHVLAYFSGRNESEVLIMPENVEIISVENISEDEPS